MLVSLPAGYQMDSAGNVRYTGPVVVQDWRPQASGSIRITDYSPK